jgi:hypothetical protein
MIPAIQLNVLKLAGEANCILSELKNYKHVLLTLYACTDFLLTTAYGSFVPFTGIRE